MIMGEGAEDIITANIRVVDEVEEEVAAEEGEMSVLRHQRPIYQNERRKNGPNWKKR